MICEKCNAEISGAARFCPKCGLKIESLEPIEPLTKKCPQCGAENPITAKFCKSDGYNLQEAPVIPQEEEMVAAIDESVVPQAPEPLLDPEEIPVAKKYAEVPNPVPFEKKETVACRTCGTQNPIGAKFCKKDGTSLNEISEPADDGDTTIKDEKPAWPQIKEEPHPAGRMNTEKKPKKSMTWLWIVVAVVIMALAGAGGYVYYSGRMSMKPADFQKIVNEELRIKNLSVIVEINNDWTATVSGPVRQQSEKELAINTVKSHKEIKSVIDNISLQRTPADIQTDINRELGNKGFTAIQARVDENYVAVLTGYASNQDEKANAVDIAKGSVEIKGIRDEINVKTEPIPQAGPIPPAPPPLGPPPPGPVPPKSAPSGVDTARLEGEINRVIRDSGIHGVQAIVRNDLTVIMKGTVRNPDEKERALQIVKGYKQVRRIKDMIFIVAS